MIQAVLADLDGTLVEAKEIHREALNKALFRICNLTLSHADLIAFEALPTRVKLKRLVERGDVPIAVVDEIWELKQTLTKYEIEQLLKPDHVKIEMLEWLNSRDIMVACVTNSITETARLMLEKTGQLAFMDLLITNEDVVHAKPSSEGFIRAMVRLQVEPCDCVIIEDSDKGIEAAVPTGAHVMRVKNADVLTKDALASFIRDIEQ